MTSKPIAEFFARGWVRTHETTWRDNVAMHKAAERFEALYKARGFDKACSEMSVCDWSGMDYLAIRRGEDIGHPDYERRMP